MFITYKTFKIMLEKTMQTKESSVYKSLLESIIEYPERYTGTFRLTNPRTKLLQNITQSNEIKFGKFLEEIVSEYIKIKGFNFLENDLIDNSENKLKIDQFFEKNEVIYLVEQKVRDDHDSTKKKGQYNNFLTKINCANKKYPNKKIIGIMWFLDPSFTKNKKFYIKQMNNNKDYSLSLYYGEEFFKSINSEEMWLELIGHLERIRKEFNEKGISIPNFDDSPEVLKALINLSDKHWSKLISEKPIFQRLREELFPNNINISKAKSIKKEETEDD